MHKKAFTLIEILVVIAIIGLLMVLIIPKLGKYRAQARDSKRIQDIREIESALVLYKQRYGVYPWNTNPSCSDDDGNGTNECSCISSIGSCDDDCWNCGGGQWSRDSALWQSLVKTDIMKQIPKDPINNEDYYYKYIPDCAVKGKCAEARTPECCYYEIKAMGLEADHPEIDKKAGDRYTLDGY